MGMRKENGLNVVRALGQALCVASLAISASQVSATNTLNTDGSSAPKGKGEVVTTSKDGVTVHSVPGANKMDRERREKREKEKK